MKSSDLSEFFNLLGKAKKEKEEEFDNLLKEADINLDDLTSNLVSGIKEAKEDQKKQKKNEEKLIEQLDSIIDVIENPKEVKDITEPAVTVGVPEDFDVTTLEDVDDNETVEIIDIIKPEPIKTSEVSDTVAQAIKFIEETNIKEEIENSDDTNLDKLKKEIKQVRDILYKVLAHGPGSGEVRILKMDDVDEDSVKVDGKVLQYQSSSSKFVGATMPSNNNQLTNGAGYITTSFTNTNQLINGAGFITASDNITGTSAGLTGTPNITVGSVIASTGTFSGNVSIAGTLTYEDVTNVDSVGLITARNGIVVGSGITLSPDGDIFSVGFSTIGNSSSGGVELYHQGVKRISSKSFGATVHGSLIANTSLKVNSYTGNLLVGVSNEFTIQHDNENTLVNNTVGILSITSSNNVAITTNSSVSGIATFRSLVKLPDSSDNQTGRLMFGDDTDLQIYHDGSHSYISDQGTGQLKLLVSTLSVKNVGDNKNALIVVPGSSTKLFFNGNQKLETQDTGISITGDLTVSGSVSEGSDIRLKTNIKPIKDPIDKVTQIEGVSFNWKKDNKPALGVIADQVEKIIPELVQGDDPKTVNYNGLIGLLIEAVKDQQTQIDSLKERLSKLE